MSKVTPIDDAKPRKPNVLLQSMLEASIIDLEGARRKRADIQRKLDDEWEIKSALVNLRSYMHKLKRLTSRGKMVALVDAELAAYRELL